MKTVVPLCVPRSGSSLLAGVLHRLGVDMGNDSDMYKLDFMNKFGCYENQDFCRLLNVVLARSGIISGWHEIPDDARVEKVVNNFKPRIKRIIKKYESSLWGWKVPGFYYIIPYVHELLTNPYYIFMERDVDSVVNSQISIVSKTVFPNIFNSMSVFRPKILFKLAFRWLKKFFKKGNVLQDEGLIRSVVVDGYSRIENFVSDKSYVRVGFKELVNHPRVVINRLIRFLNINPSQEEVNHALSFVHPELRNF